jgi:hypothetical protein
MPEATEATAVAFSIPFSRSSQSPLPQQSNHSSRGSTPRASASQSITTFNKGKKRKAPGRVKSESSRKLTSKSKRPVNKLASEVHRLVKGEVSKRTGGLQVRYRLILLAYSLMPSKSAMLMHVRLLWGLIDKNVPSDPPKSLIKDFALRFSTQNLVDGQRHGPQIIPPSLVKIGTHLITGVGSKTAAQYRRIEEHILSYIQGYLARFGMKIWCPDLRQSPYSLYNSACRIIALDTFKQALVCHAYTHLKPNTSYVQDVELLGKMYDHWVHYYFYKRYLKECKLPGSVQAADETNPTYQNRKRVCFYFLFHVS